MKPNKKNIKYIIILVLLLLNIIAFYFAFNNEDAHGNTNLTTIDILHDYNNMYQKLEYQNRLYASASLVEDERKKIFNADMPATISWSILGDLSLYKATEQDAYLKRAQASFQKWTALADGTQENFSLFQLVRASMLVPDNSQFKNTLKTWFWGRIKGLSYQYKSMKRKGRIAIGNPMLLAIMHSQFIEAYRLTQDDIFMKILCENKQIQDCQNIEQIKIELKEKIDYLTKIISDSINSEIYSKPNLVEDEDLPQQICWQIWGKYQNYTTFGNEIDILTVKSLLQRLNLVKNPSKKLNYVTLQNILPCTEVMLDLGTKYKKEVKSIFENSILHHFDNKKTNICDGSGGFISKQVHKQEKELVCKRNAKYLSDSAWINYQLLQFDAEENFTINGKNSF